MKKIVFVLVSWALMFVSGFTQTIPEHLVRFALAQPQDISDEREMKAALLYHVSNYTEGDLLVQATEKMDSLSGHGKSNVLEIPPLVAAAYTGNMELVQWFLDRGCNVNETGKKGFSPLMMAAMSGNPEIIRRFVELGADVNAKSEEKNFMALAIIVHIMQISTRFKNNVSDAVRMKEIDYLMHAGVSQEHLDRALIVACRYKNLQLIQRLVDAGADVSRAYESESPLIVAAERNNVRAAQYLLAQKADPNVLNDKGENALHKVSRNTSNLIMYLLIRAGICINQQDNDGNTPVLDAARCRSFYLMRCLIENGADMTIPNKDGKSVSYYLSLYGLKWVPKGASGSGS